MKKKLADLGSFLVFAGPATFIFAFVILYAFANGIFLTFTDWNGLTEGFNFVGFQNYIDAFMDKDFWTSMLLTFKYVIIVVIFTNVVAFSIAFLLTRKFKGQGIFRTGFFTPNLIGGVILGIIWKFIFSEVFAQMGKMYEIGMFKNNWLSQPNTALFALIVVAVWQLAGYLMLIYMAGIITVPKEVTEAASLDGAVGLTGIIKIVLPLIMSSVTICGFMSLKTAFMAYDVNLSLTQGGPYNQTTLVAMSVYNKAFVSEQYGVGQTQAIILFLVVAIITVTQVTLSKKQEVES